MRQVALYLLSSLILCSLMAWGLAPVVLDGQEDESFEDAFSFLANDVKFPLKVEQSNQFGPILPSDAAPFNRNIYLLDECFLI